MTKPRDPGWEARGRAVFAAQGMMRTLGIEMDAFRPGEVVLRAPIRPESGQQHGYGHSALAFAMGDTAAGIAANSLMGPGEGVLTVEMKINLLAPAAGAALVARGFVERAGRRLSVVRADVVAVGHDGSEKSVATMLGTMAVVPDGP